MQPALRVLVRLSVSHHQGDDIGEADRIVREVLAARPPQPPLGLAVQPDAPGRR